MRADMLATKTRQVQEELATWAKENGILDPGEQLMFSLKIEAVPTVVHDSQDKKDVPVSLEMEAEDFFTRSRILHEATRLGYTVATVTRISGVIQKEIQRSKSISGNDKYSMLDFLKDFPDEQQILRLLGIGRKSAHLVSEILRNSNLYIVLGQ